MRLFWFCLAAIVSVPLNPALFYFFQKTFELSDWLAYAFSLSLVSLIQFIWSYNIGFKSNDHWTTSAVRQGAAMAAASAINYLLVLALLPLFPSWKTIVIVTVQVAVAGMKFLVYHFWVYPPCCSKQESPAFSNDQ